MGLFGGKKTARGDSASRPAKKTKATDEWKHLGLPAVAKNLLKKARQHMGSKACPELSPEMKATMEDFRAGRYGAEPWGSVNKQRVTVMLLDPQMIAIWNAFLVDVNGGLTRDSQAYTITAAWFFLGDIFVMFLATQLSTTQASVAMLDLDAVFWAVVAEDPSDALTMWDGKAFVNGAPSPVSVKVAAAAAAAMAKPAPAVQAPVQTRWGPTEALRAPTSLYPPRGPPRPMRAGASCNYCRTMRGIVDATHWANQCPHNPFKK